MTSIASFTTNAAPSSAYALLAPKEAGLFYEDACRREGLHIHSTFLKQLLQGSVLIQFENGYLGGSGISPIVQTLQRIPLRALLLSRCALNPEDVKLLCAGLATHPQLEKIDVRGVDLSIGAVKELLHLAARNTRVTEILMDEGLPKFVAIQQQCQRNAQAAVASMSACVICGAGVSVEARASCETAVLRFVLESLKPQTHPLSAACLTVLCKALQHCTDRNDGVLSVCGEACGESLAEDLCRCVWSVSKAFVWRVPFEQPKAQFLRVLLAHLHAQLQRNVSSASLPVSSSSSSQQSAVTPAVNGTVQLQRFFLPGPVDAQAEEVWRTKKPRSDIDDFFDNRADRDVSLCGICGQPGVCSTDGATWLLRTLEIDLVQHGVTVTPAALLRLCEMLTTRATVQPCSRRCLRHVVRFALYGYGGVNCSYVGGFPPLTSVLGGTQELLRLPLIDFTVVDIAEEAVHDVASEEINCALTVASSVRDTAGVAMDPYLIFSIGRQLRKMAVGSIGLDLAGACEAVRMVGCLPEKDAPFQRADGNVTHHCASGNARTGAAPRDLVADWPAWSAASGPATVRRWLHAAFAHRRQRVCAVDGPHRDLFDNIRAALWALRQQSRCVLVTLKVSLSWLSLKDGVVPSTSSAHTHGFCTTGKVIGQVTRANTVFLVVQCPLGRHVGHSGLLYVPKTVFLQCVRGLAFMFADAVGLEYREAGWRASLYGNALVGPALGVADSDVRRLHQLFVYAASYIHGRKRMDGAAWKLVGDKVPAELLRRLLDPAQLPAALAFVREVLHLAAPASAVALSAADETGVTTARTAHRPYWERILFSSRYPSQLLFFFSEMLGSGTWLQRAVVTASELQLNCSAKSDAFSAASSARETAAATPSPAAAAETEPPYTAPATVATTRAADGVEETRRGSRVWQTIGSVPELSSLRNELTAMSAEAAARVDATTPAKSGRKKAGAAKATVVASDAAAAASTSRPPRPPPTASSTTTQQQRPSSSRRRVSSVASAANDSVSMSAAPPRSAQSAKTSQAMPDQSMEGKGGGASTTTATVTAPPPPPPMDRAQVRLQKSWRAERAGRNVLLSDASRVGVVEYLRTRIHDARIGEAAPPSAATVTGAAELPPTMFGPGSGGAFSTTDPLQSVSAGEIPAHLLGKPWFIIPVPFEYDVKKSADELPVVSADLHLLFIGNCSCVYSMHESRLLCPPAAMSADPLTATFPFARGIDAATLHPTNPALIFFFSGREWFLFDLALFECIDGPYPLHLHGQFRKLPPLFHEGVDSVVAIPGSSQLVFFRDYAYVVFDVVTRRCVGGVGQLDVAQILPPVPSSSSSAAAAALSGRPLPMDSVTATRRSVTALASACAANGACSTAPSGAVSGTMDGDSDADTAAQEGEASAPMTSALRIAPELQRRLGTAPMTSFSTCDGTAGASAAHWLVDRRGGVVAVRWDCVAAPDTAAAGSAQQQQSQRWVLRCADAPSAASASTPLAQLPLVFRQDAPAALSAICALAVQTNFHIFDSQAECTPSGGVANLPSARLELFDPESGQHDLLAATPADNSVNEASTHAPSYSPSGMADSQSSLYNSHGQTAMLAGTVATVAAGADGGEETAAASRDLARGAGVTITSSLVATSVAHRMPLALSRSGPVVSRREPAGNDAANCGWGTEVFFYGDSSTGGVQQSGTSEAAGAAHASSSARRSVAHPLSVQAEEKAVYPRLFIEYDLGVSAQRRIFCAVLLVLDTSLLPPSVLQLAPLLASVECSVEGEVYRPQALLRITGAVTAVKWGGDPLTVETGAARFWRLRLHAPLPAMVGVVRLFWFEIPHGLPRQTTYPVPFSPYAPLPLGVRATATSGSVGSGANGGISPVSVEAEAVVASPELLLRGDNARPVFVDNPSPHALGCYGHHTAFPLLGEQRTAVLCCGASLVEVQVGDCVFSAGESVALPPPATANSFAQHPGFRGLPYPFALGWDANFYPSPQSEPGLLCLLQGESMLLWDMATGQARGDAVDWRRSAVLEGLSATPVARILAAVNCWSTSEGDESADEASDGCVVGFFFEPSSVDRTAAVHYVEFDVAAKKVVAGPVSLASHVWERYGAATPAEATLLTALCSPHAPSTLYLFYEKTVQALTVCSPATKPASTQAAAQMATPLAQSAAFFAVPLLLPRWGTRLRRCRITLDVASLLHLFPSPDGQVQGESEGTLVVGMQLTSNGGQWGSVSRWLVQCSQEGRMWEDVAVHEQKAGGRVVSETSWAPRAVGRYSKTRYWRFTRLSLTSGAEVQAEGGSSPQHSDDSLQSYSQLRLLAVPRQRGLLVPVRVSGAAAETSSAEACAAFFSGVPKATLSVCGRVPELGGATEPLAQSGAECIYELVWDYGLTLTVLSGVVFAVKNRPANVQLTWTVYGSSLVEAEQWNPLDTTTTLTQEGATCYSLSWVPNGPYRYWRLVGTAAQIPNHSTDTLGCPPALILAQLRVYEYVGPLVGLVSSNSVFLESTSLLWPTSAKAEVPGNLVTSVNSCLQIYRMAEALTSCRVDFLVSGACSAYVAVEWSADATEWYTVAVTTSSISDVADHRQHHVALSWQSSGPRRLWRVRVVDLSSDVTFLPLRLHLGTSPAGHLMKLTSREFLLDTAPSPHGAAAVFTPAPSRKGSVQLMDRPLSVHPSINTASPAAAATAATSGEGKRGAAAAAAKMMADLSLASPQRLVGVRAALPSPTARYAVEYLGLDGVSWLSAAVLEGNVDPVRERKRVLSNALGWASNVAGEAACGASGAGAAASPPPQACPTLTLVWWDGASVSPSTQWRLRPLNAAGEQQAGTPQPQKPRAVEWFADVGSASELVDMSEVPGVMTSTTGFTEVQQPHCLSGANKAAAAAGRAGMKGTPVLQCSVLAKRNGSFSSGPAGSTVTWSFISPLLLDQLTLHLRATPKAVQGSGGEAAVAVATAEEGAAPAKSEAAVQSIWVETSDNGEDYVAVAQALWRPNDTTVVLSWEEVPAASFWRLRLSRVATRTASDSAASPRITGYTLDIFAAHWSVWRSAPALTANHRGVDTGSFTNTSYRAWVVDTFSREDAFMKDCQDALDEVRSAESKLRTSEELGPAAQVAAAVQRMKVQYQAFLQKAAKEAARRSRAAAEEESAAAAPTAGTATGTANNNNNSVSTFAGGEETRPSTTTPATLPHRAHAHLLSPSHAASDILLMLLESAASSALAGEKFVQLAELVGHPLAFRDALRFSKKPARWFYPCLEAVGQPAEDWYGFAADSLNASYCVLWSLSTALQRRRDVLTTSDDIIAPLSEHVASPLVVVQINEVGWSPCQRFPGVPFLYATNAHERPTTVVFALNDVLFTPPYALGVPSGRESQPLISPFPYTVYAGVNFVQTRSLDSCPAPVFDALRYILPAWLFSGGAPASEATTRGPSRGRGNNSMTDSSYSKKSSRGSNQVLMVLTASSLHARSNSSSSGGDGGCGGGDDGASAQLRFTVPADGVNFGMQSLVMDTLEFEIQIKAEGPTRRWTYQTTFVSHGARFVSTSGSAGSGARTEVPVSLLGHVEMHGLPVISLRGNLGNARVASVAEIPGAVVTSLAFHTIAQVEKVPADITGSPGDGGDTSEANTVMPWICSALQAEGRVMLPGMPFDYACTCVVTPLEAAGFALHVSGIQVALQRASLGEVQSFCHACSGAASGPNRKEIAFTPAFPLQSVDMCGVRVQLAAMLKVTTLTTASARRRGTSTLYGKGLLLLDNYVLHGATVEADCATQTATIAVTCPHTLRLGALALLGTEEHPLSLQVLLTKVAPPPQKANSGAASRAVHRLLVAGSAALFGRERVARVALELSWSTDAGHVVTLAATSVRHPFLEATLQDSAVSRSWRYTQVTVDEAAICEALVRELGNVPIVAALCAHGVPLTCVVSSVAAAPYDLVTQRLFVRVRGLLFGAAFDAATSVTSPDDLEDVWAAMAADLCPEIVEQCEENLWASYANVVGCRIVAQADASGV